MRRRFVMGRLSIGVVALAAGVVSGQDYPSKPIRIISGGTGGSADFTVRLIAQEVSEPLGQRVIVDNRAGVISGETVARAAPDGYTLLFQGGTFWILSLLQKTPYDPIRDFSAITQASNTPNLLVVHPSVPVKSVKELIALAKARPGELNYGSGATASSNHLAAELFKAMANVNIVRVSYKGVVLVVNDLISGQIHLAFPTPAGTLPHVKAGRLVALAVTSAKPFALLPNVPTVAAAGLAGYESGAPYGLLAPAGTPAAIINRLNQEVVRIIRRPDVAEKLIAVESDAVGSSPQEFAAKIAAEMAKWSKLIKDAGISTN